MVSATVTKDIESEAKGVRLMSRYLVVAQQTADSPELISKIADIAAGDPAAEFVLLVPVTPVRVLLSTAEEKVAFDTAHQTAEAARSLFEKAGAKVIGVRVGDDSLIRAIRDELREHPDNYDAIILSTLSSPTGCISTRLVKCNTPSICPSFTLQFTRTSI